MSHSERRALSGVWAFILALVPFAWLATALLLAFAATTGNEVAMTFASPIAIGSFAVVPIFSLVAIILAVVALAVANVPGKIFGGVALLVVTAQIVLVIVLLSGASDLPAQAL